MDDEAADGRLADAHGEVLAMNACVHSFAAPGLLPWESLTDFADLTAAFRAEHAPQGRSELSLVDRLVWIEWRRRRFVLAERAAHLAGLAERLDDPHRTLARAGLRMRRARERLDLEEILTSGPDKDAKACRDHVADRAATARALAILERGGRDAYLRAVGALHADTRTWWEDGLAGEYGDERTWTADDVCLAAFLREEVAPTDETIAAANQARPAARLQAIGESFDPARMERLLSIESRLDRQFDKALSTLVQLQGLRTRHRPEVGA